MAKKWDEGNLGKTSRDKRSFGAKTAELLKKKGVISPIVKQKFLIKPGLWVYSKKELKTDAEVDQFVNEMRVKYNC